MANHVQFMDIISAKPIFVLRKEFSSVKAGRRASTIAQIEGAYITVKEQEVGDNLTVKSKLRYHRVFATTRESEESGYNKVGWVIKDELSVCMICFKKFGLRNSKHHCRACGNLICNACGPDKKLIKTLEAAGPFRVCTICSFGQVRDIATNFFFNINIYYY